MRTRRGMWALALLGVASLVAAVVPIRSCPCQRAPLPKDERVCRRCDGQGYLYPIEAWIADGSSR